MMPTQLRWGPCWYGQAAVKRPDAGSIPATAALNGRASQLATATVPKTVEPPTSRVPGLEGSTPSPSAECALGRAAEVPAFQAGEAGSTPAGHFETQLSIPGSSLMVVMPDFESGVRRFDSYPRNLTQTVLRDRLTVGRDALNVLMLVRFQLPQLRHGSHPAG